MVLDKVKQDLCVSKVPPLPPPISSLISCAFSPVIRGGNVFSLTQTLLSVLKVLEQEARPGDPKCLVTAISLSSASSSSAQKPGVSLKKDEQKVVINVLTFC